MNQQYQRIFLLWLVVILLLSGCGESPSIPQPASTLAPESTEIPITAQTDEDIAEENSAAHDESESPPIAAPPEPLTDTATLTPAIDLTMIPLPPDSLPIPEDQLSAQVVRDDFTRQTGLAAEAVFYSIPNTTTFTDVITFYIESLPTAEWELTTLVDNQEVPIAGWTHQRTDQLLILQILTPQQAEIPDEEVLSSILASANILSLILTAPMPPTEATPEGQSPPSPAPAESPSAQIDQMMHAFIGEREPGAAVLVMQQGNIVHSAGYGVMNIETQEPITPDTVFHLASSGKQFTGLALMLLQAQGKLTFDDPISLHLPELGHMDIGLTIRHVAQHTAGIPDMEDNLRERFDMPSNDDLLALLIENGTTDFAPGEKFAYSNTGYEVLGSLIERVSGQPFPVFFAQHIAEPAQMHHTFSLPNDIPLAQANRATGYDALGNGLFELDDSDALDRLVGSGSIYSTVNDLVQYEQALENNTLLSAEAFAEALKPAQLLDGSEYPYGFGWDIGLYQGVAYSGHSGEWNGCTSVILRFPDERLAIFILSNRTDTAVEELAFQIATLYL